MIIKKCNNINDINLDNKDLKVITWGKYDAMHLGHQTIMNKMMSLKGDKRTGAVIFAPGPESYFDFPDKTRVNTLNESLEIIENIGLDYAFVVPFDEKTANIGAGDYLDKVINGTGADTVVVGKDVSFGYNREGDDKYLTMYGKDKGLDIHIVSKIEIDGQIVSSNAIKNYIKNGDMIKSAKMLGRKYSIEGVVQRGKGIGHKELYATINIAFDDNKCVPKFGVYYSRALIKGKEYTAITNVGVAPTFGATKKPVSESFILEFNEEVYGEKVLLYIDEFRRPEKKFGSAAELKQVIDEDLEAIVKYYNK